MDNKKDQGGKCPDGAVVMCFPEHKSGMTIEHNNHKGCYMSVSDWAEENDMFDWESKKEKQRAINNDELWTVQWYPDTPVGFYAVAASTLESALAFANKEI